MLPNYQVGFRNDRPVTIHDLDTAPISPVPYGEMATGEESSEGDHWPSRAQDAIVNPLGLRAEQARGLVLHNMELDASSPQRRLHTRYFVNGKAMTVDETLAQIRSGDTRSPHLIRLGQHFAAMLLASVDDEHHWSESDARSLATSRPRVSTAKVANTYAIFDVAKERLLHRVSKWRERMLKPVLSTCHITGSFTRCEGTSLDAVSNWRRSQPARFARLISICSHGTDATVQGCSDHVQLYTDGVTAYAEVPGAILHLTSCETLGSLGSHLVENCGADAVIGYYEPFVLSVPDFAAAEPNSESTKLPNTLRETLGCDIVVLKAIARGKSVGDAVGQAKQWARSKTLSIRHAVRRILDECGVQCTSDKQRRVLELCWSAANLAANVSCLDHLGNPDATITNVENPA